jgi:hypothetical protein
MALATSTLLGSRTTSAGAGKTGMAASLNQAVNRHLTHRSYTAKRKRRRHRTLDNLHSFQLDTESVDSFTEHEFRSDLMRGWVSNMQRQSEDDRVYQDYDKTLGTLL